MWVPLILNNFRNTLSFLVQGWSLNLSSARVCSCNNLYPIITKLIVLFKSRSGNVAFDVDYDVGDYHNKTNCIIDCVLLYVCSL